MKIPSAIRLTVILFAGLLFFTFSVSSIYGQSNSFFNRAGFYMHSGYLIPHDKSIKHLESGPFPVFHFSISGETHGSLPWHQLYNNPLLGFDFMVVDMGMPEVLGRAYAFMPHIKLPFFRSQSYFLYARHALGLGYLTRHHDNSSQQLNLAIGSAVNIGVNVSMGFQWKLNESVFLNSGISLIHFSNGKIRTPNKGLNIPTFNMGIEYRTGESSSELHPALPLTKPTTDLIILGAAGFSASYPPGSGSAERFTLSTTANIPVGLKHKLGLGYDFFVSSLSLAEKEAERFSDPVFNHGFHLSFQQNFGKLSFILHNGIYVWDPQEFRDYFYYNRAGLRYNVSSGILLSLTLKTHLFQAEFIEWGLGYVIR